MAETEREVMKRSFCHVLKIATTSFDQLSNIQYPCLALAALIFSSSCIFAQSARLPGAQKVEVPLNSSNQKSESVSSNIPFLSGPIEVLSNTNGVDLNDYLQKIIERVRTNWYDLIPMSARRPKMKKGKVVIEFAILKEGAVAGVKIAASSGSLELDRAAWGGISLSNPFQPLPAAYRGNFLQLRFHFYYNPGPDELAILALHATGTVVSISPARGLAVPVGGSAIFTASVAGNANTAVKWSVTGSGCSSSACGTMMGSSYVAPGSLPNPPSVKVTATSEADPTASASIIINLISAEGLRVLPASAKLPSGTKVQFSALLGTENVTVKWSVSGVGCMGASCGTISAEGFYAAPTNVPNPSTVTVTATSTTDSNITASATATILQANPAP